MSQQVKSAARLATRYSLALGVAFLVACTPQSASQPTTAPAAGPTAAPKAAAPAGAPQATAAPAGKPATSSEPQGTITYVGVDFAAERMDPSTSPGNPFESTSPFGTGGPIYEPLFAHMPPNAEVKPYLLESGTMSSDGLTWTLKLKDGIRFSNGDPMTADDVKFSLDRYRSDAATSASAALFRQKFASVDVVDRLTTRIILKDPIVALPVYLAGRAGGEGVVLPKKYIEQVGWDQFNEQPIGSGPYRMVEHKAGDSYTYEAVENHWRSKALFQRVRILAVPEERSRIAMLQSGQADAIIINPGSKQEIERAGFNTLSVPYAANWRIHFYGQQSSYATNPLQKLEVRKALTLAINKQDMLTALGGGVGEVANYANSAPGATLGAPTLPPTPYDPAEARRLLQQAGLSNLELTLWATNAGCSVDDARQFGSATAAYWEQIGVKTNIRTVDYTVFRPQIIANPHPSEIVGTASTFCTGSGPLAERDLSLFWYSKGGSFRMAQAGDSDIEEAQRALTIEGQFKAAEAAYQKIQAAYENIGIFHVSKVYGVNQKMAGYPITPGWSSMTLWLVADRPQ